MSNKQVWTTIILSFILSITLVTAGFVYGILHAPAATSEFLIKGEAVFEIPEVGTIKIHEVSGSVNSKVLDLILLMIHD